MKRGLALQKKLVKHYARKSMLANAKLKQALMELEELKNTKVHESLGILAYASQHMSKTPLGVYTPILRQIQKKFVFSKF